MLLALVREEGAARARLVLNGLGIPPERLRAALETSAANAPAYPAELPFDGAARKVLERCIAYGRHTGRCTTDQLLLAIAVGKAGLAGELLRWHGATPERVPEVVAGLPPDAGE